MKIEAAIEMLKALQEAAYDEWYNPDLGDEVIVAIDLAIDAIQALEKISDIIAKTDMEHAVSHKFNGEDDGFIEALAEIAEIVEKKLNANDLMEAIENEKTKKLVDKTRCPRCGRKVMANETVCWGCGRELE